MAFYNYGTVRIYTVNKSYKIKRGKGFEWKTHTDESKFVYDLIHEDKHVCDIEDYIELQRTWVRRFDYGLLKFEYTINEVA
tara:strand:- start:450 stop:692 length:243 start_codon:yes stop_codon:yes gene_type:complete